MKRKTRMETYQHKKRMSVLPPLLTHLVAEAARLDSHLPDNREKKRLDLNPIQLENGIQFSKKSRSHARNGL